MPSVQDDNVQEVLDVLTKGLADLKTNLAQGGHKPDAIDMILNAPPRVVGIAPLKNSPVWQATEQALLDGAIQVSDVRAFFELAQKVVPLLLGLPAMGV
jgi:hypothetical protein